MADDSNNEADLLIAELEKEVTELREHSEHLQKLLDEAHGTIKTVLKLNRAKITGVAT